LIKLIFRTLNIINILFFWIFFWDHLVFSIIPYFLFRIFFIFLFFESAIYEKIVENNLFAHRGKTLALLLLTSLLGKKFRVKILLWICVVEIRMANFYNRYVVILNINTNININFALEKYMTTYNSHVFTTQKLWSNL